MNKPINLFLVRHADAEPPGSKADALRSLTPHGRRQMKRCAAAFAEHASQVDVIWTSPLVRAVQTAEILAQAIGLEEQIWASDLIAHPPALEALSSLVSELPANTSGVAIVGHEPTLSDYTAHLLQLEELPRPFKKGMIVALETDRVGRTATFKWLLAGTPPNFSDIL